MNTDNSPVFIPENTQGLIFDLDGTLADTMPIHYGAWEIVAKLYSFSFPEHLFYQWAGVRTHRIAELLNETFGYSLDPHQMEQEKEKTFLSLCSRIEPIQPVKNILLAYHELLPIAIGTGNLRHLAEITLQSIGLSEIIKFIVTAEDVVNFKPAPDTFLACAEQMGVSPANCVVFEDGDLGIEAAHRAGMHAIDIRPLYVDWRRQQSK